MRSALNICKAGNQSGYPFECNKNKSGASVFESNFLGMTFSSEFLSKMSPSSRPVIDPVSREKHSLRLLRPLHTSPGPLPSSHMNHGNDNRLYGSTELHHFSQKATLLPWPNENGESMPCQLECGPAPLLNRNGNFHILV